MHISQIQSFSFSGNFYNNELLTPILKEANNYELKRFSEVLKRMGKVDDKRNYVLSSRPDFYTKTKELFIQEKENKNFYTSIAVCGISKSFSFANCLERINNFLESIYPLPKTTNNSRESILADIKNTLKQ